MIRHQTCETEYQLARITLGTLEICAAKPPDSEAPQAVERLLLDSRPITIIAMPTSSSR
jgi:hypothetical protein